jgi:hypothetical protein
MTTETLNFEIEIGGTYWDRKPQYSIWIDDVKYLEGEVASASDEFDTVKFSADLIDSKHVLKIRLENKQDSDTVQNDDKTAIVNDMLLNIGRIVVDEVDLGEIVYMQSKFRGDDASRPTLTQCVNLGWNGSWELEFSCPFFIWLLETL